MRGVRMISLLAALCLLVSPFGLQNGDFRQVDGGRPVGWAFNGDCRVISDGGRNGMPAVETRSTGKERSFAVQKLQFDPARRGSFVVSAWMRCDEADESSQCSVWLDVIQKDAPPIWGQRGFPEVNRKGWQLVRSVVTPTHPVTQVGIHLMLEGKGRVRFADVRIEELPFEIKDLRVRPSGEGYCDVRAAMSDAAPWKLVARQRDREIWSKTGEGAYIADRFSVASDAQVSVTLTSQLGATVRSASRTVVPGRRGSSLDWWIADPMTSVFQEDILPDRPVRRAALDMARRERESFQLCLRAISRPMVGVRVSVSDLVSSAGRIPASDIQWYRVGYLWVKHPYPHPANIRGDGTWWPDPLLPAREFSIEPGRTQPLWFTVYARGNVQPGTYKGSVTLTSEGIEPISVPMIVEVHRATVPVQGRMKTAFALMDGYINKLYGNIPRKLRRSYTDYMLDHRLNLDDITRTEPPDVRELVYADKRGQNAFCILNVVPRRGHSDAPLGDWPTLWTCFAPVEAYTPRFKKEFFERLDAIIPELDRRGLLEKSYIYGFDERGPEYFPIMRDLFGEIKRRYPKVHTLSTCRPPAGTDPLSLGIDWYVPLSPLYDPKLAAEVRERGGEMWWYTCMGPRYPYANILLDDPRIESRLIWWQAFDYRVDGYLFWAVNLWDYAGNDKLIPDSAGPRIDWCVTAGGDTSLNGDGVFIYPGENGPIGSIRMENIRDGLEDTEILSQYKERVGEAAAKKLISKVTVDRTHFSRDPQNLLRARQSMLRAISSRGPQAQP